MLVHNHFYRTRFFNTYTVKIFLGLILHFDNGVYMFSTCDIKKQEHSFYKNAKVHLLQFFSYDQP